MNSVQEIAAEEAKFYNTPMEHWEDDYIDKDYDHRLAFWFEGILDYEILTSSTGDTKCVSIFTTLGGPTVKVNFFEEDKGTVEVSWGGEQATEEFEDVNGFFCTLQDVLAST